MDKSQAYNLKRVHKVNMFATCGIVAFFILKSLIFSKGGWVSDLIYSMPLALVAVGIYFLPIKDLIKGQLFAGIPALAMFALFLVDGVGLEKHYILFISIAMITLYFEAKRILIHGVLIDACYIIWYIMFPDKIMFSSSLNAFLSAMIMMNGVMIFLFFLTKWGKELVNKTVEKQAENDQMMTALSATIGHIDESVIVLNDSMNTMFDNAKATQDSSNQVSIAMQEIAVGVQEQAESVTDINMQVTNISEDVNEAHNISNNITSTNEKMMDEVTSGEAQIKVMKDQMVIIDDAIEAAIVTVNDLEKSMSNIQNFLEVITSISTQTNLLALNASIESARAGEAGKGFAVVAEEIRKLAEQSAKSVIDISNIVTEVTSKTQDAVKIVDQGNTAIDEGSDIIENITTQYASIKQSFIENNQELSREMDMIDRINESFNIVHERISNIASISQEQSASTQEILATVENQAENISGLTESLKEIERLGQELAETASSHR